MAAFDGSVRTPTRIAITGDSFSPGMGSLVGSAFKEDVMNHGTLNQLVMGNITRTFLANETISITGNQTITVLANQTQTISGNQIETITGVCLQNVIGQLIQTYVAGQMTLCAGPHMRTDLTTSVWMCPSATMINSGDIMETKIQKMGAFAFRYTAVGVDVATRLVKTDLNVNVTNVKAIETYLNTLQNRLIAGLKNRAIMLAIAIEATRADIKGIHPEVRAARPAIGIELSVPPDSMPGIQ